MLLEMMREKGLVDVWRTENPDKKEYTRRQLRGGQLKQSRIDLVLASKETAQLIGSIQHHVNTLSDHDAVSLVPHLDLSRLNASIGTGIQLDHLPSGPMITWQLRIDDHHDIVLQEVISWLVPLLAHLKRRLGIKDAFHLDYDCEQDFFLERLSTDHHLQSFLDGLYLTLPGATKVGSCWQTKAQINQGTPAVRSSRRSRQSTARNGESVEHGLDKSGNVVHKNGTGGISSEV
ncbi:unnamed protein product [Merluccius merluccius]